MVAFVSDLPPPMTRAHAYARRRHEELEVVSALLDPRDGTILFVGFMASLKNSRGEEVRAKSMPAYKKMLEGMRDSTENQLRRLADRKMRLFRTSVTGDDVEVTQEQIRVLRSQLNELNRMIIP